MCYSLPTDVTLGFDSAAWMLIEDDMNHQLWECTFFKHNLAGALNALWKRNQAMVSFT